MVLTQILSQPQLRERSLPEAASLLIDVILTLTPGPAADAARNPKAADDGQRGIGERGLELRWRDRPRPASHGTPLYHPSATRFSTRFSGATGPRWSRSRHHANADPWAFRRLRRDLIALQAEDRGLNDRWPNVSASPPAASAIAALNIRDDHHAGPAENDAQLRVVFLGPA